MVVLDDDQIEVELRCGPLGVLVREVRRVRVARDPARGHVEQPKQVANRLLEALVRQRVREVAEMLAEHGLVVLHDRDRVLELAADAEPGRGR